ncbi:hypothetical protein GIB67_006874 [Kingdonia uniflora]|uniref:PDZ domain-containing protein n=1 Tax=Kingdonia uniflora TaxID=39325 RepID=A0A7J7L092_9MAGN|nr:hypothetical protein GIB67_006874 [Kingdonia uniflora]
MISFIDHLVVDSYCNGFWSAPGCHKCVKRFEANGIYLHWHSFFMPQSSGIGALPDVTGVTPGSPADRAGFSPGDVVIEFEGKTVGSIKEIIEEMGDKVGKPLKVVVKRAKDELVTLTVVPEEANPEI